MRGTAKYRWGNSSGSSTFCRTAEILRPKIDGECSEKVDYLLEHKWFGAPSGCTESPSHSKPITYLHASPCSGNAILAPHVRGQNSCSIPIHSGGSNFEDCESSLSTTPWVHTPPDSPLKRFARSRTGLLGAHRRPAGLDPTLQQNIINKLAQSLPLAFQSRIPAPAQGSPSPVPERANVGFFDGGDPGLSPNEVLVAPSRAIPFFQCGAAPESVGAREALECLPSSDPSSTPPERVGLSLLSQQLLLRTPSGGSGGAVSGGVHTPPPSAQIRPPFVGSSPAEVFPRGPHRKGASLAGGPPRAGSLGEGVGDVSGPAGWSEPARAGSLPHQPAVHARPEGDISAGPETDLVGPAVFGIVQGVQEDAEPSDPSLGPTPLRGIRTIVHSGSQLSLFEGPGSPTGSPTASPLAEPSALREGAVAELVSWPLSETFQGEWVVRPADEVEFDSCQHKSSGWLIV